MIVLTTDVLMFCFYIFLAKVRKTENTTFAGPLKIKLVNAQCKFEI